MGNTHTHGLQTKQMFEERLRSRSLPRAKPVGARPWYMATWHRDMRDLCVRNGQCSPTATLRAYFPQSLHRRMAEAAKAGQLGVVQFLLAIKGLQLHIKDPLGYTALCWALRHQHLEVSQLLAQLMFPERFHALMSQASQGPPSADFFFKSAQAARFAGIPYIDHVDFILNR